MAWVRVDDQFPDHPKVVALGPDRLPGIGLFLVGLAYANRFLTDGWIPADAIPARSRRLAARLVTVGLWEALDPQDAAEADGWHIHDFTEYQLSRAEIYARRAADRARAMNARSGRTPDGIREDSGRNPRRVRLTPNPTPTSSVTPTVGVGTNPTPTSGRTPGGFRPDGRGSRTPEDRVQAELEAEHRRQAKGFRHE